MKRILPLALLPFVFACQPKEKIVEDPFEQLTQHVDQYSSGILSNGNMNSMSVAIYRDGKSYHQYYGEIETGSGIQANDSSLFEIASISKIFLGSLVARAVQEEKITLDDDIRTYLPQEYPNLEFEGA